MALFFSDTAISYGLLSGLFAARVPDQDAFNEAEPFQHLVEEEQGDVWHGYLCQICRGFSPRGSSFFLFVCNFWLLFIVPSSPSSPSSSIYLIFPPWLSHLRHSLPSHQMARLVALLWSLWKTRNSIVFRNETSTPGMSLLRAKRASAEWRIRNKLSLPYHPPLPHHSPRSRSHSKWIMWRKPPGGFVKLNFDGSKSSQGAAGGYLIRDWTGRFLQAASFNLGCSSVLVAEATALRNGVQAAVQAGFKNIHIEGDNRTLIQAVLKEIHVPWEIQVLVQDISTFITSFTHVVINHTFRQGNRAADWLAKFALSVHSTHVWHVVPPRDLFPFLFDDNLGRALERRAS